ncbi:hypothetical protein BH09PAT3_BH09PAT3_1810 [soil metagenome]
MQIKRIKKRYYIIAAPIILVLIGVIVIDVQDRHNQQLINQDLLAVASKLELYKNDHGTYPSSDELRNVFATNPRYTVPDKKHGKLYPGALTFENNFFYCKQDDPVQYVLLVIKGYDDAVYVTNGPVIKTYDYEAMKRQGNQSKYPFHVHTNSKQDICPAVLPTFTDSTMGHATTSTSSTYWADWTGIY